MRNHLDDDRLIDLVLTREADDHLSDCESCSGRAERLRLELGAEPVDGVFDDDFFSRQAVSINQRLDSNERRPWNFLAPRFAWAGGALAMVLVSTLALLQPTPMATPTAETVIDVASLGSPEEVLTEADLEDDQLLREIASMLDEDPYDVTEEFLVFEDWGGEEDAT